SFALPRRARATTIPSRAHAARVSIERMPAMQTLSFWVRPAVFAVLWVLAAALTVAEVATIGPSLQSAGGMPPPRLATIPLPSQRHAAGRVRSVHRRLSTF